MTPLRRLAITFAPFLVSGACAKLIGLSEFEKGAVSDGDGDEGGESGAGGNRGGNGGSSGSLNGGSGGRGGSRTGGEGGMGGGSPGGEAGDGGEAGMGGEPSGGTGGVAPRGGAGGMGGMGGTAGSAGGGTGGSAGGNCSTVVVPLASANFDQDAAAWIPYSDGSALPIIVTGASLSITADTTPNVAHLGGADSQYSGVFQPITIPAGAVTLMLVGYRQIVTEEDPQASSYDDMAIQMWEDALNPTPETRVGEFVYFSNQNPTNGWTMFTGTMAVGAYAGQTVDFDMWGFTDSTLLTHFYIDSLALTALVCQ